MAFRPDEHPNAGNGHARTGDFLHGTKTPNCLLQTEYGQVPYLPPELLNTIPGTGAAAVRLSHFYPYVQTSGDSWNVEKLHDLLNIGSDRPIVLTQRNYATNSSVSQGKKTLTLETWNGRRQIDTTGFIESTEKVGPDAVIPMHYEFPRNSSKRPNVRQTSEILALSHQWQQDCSNALRKSKSLHATPALLAYCECSESRNKNMEKCIALDPEGIVLGGFCSSTSMNQIEASLAELRAMESCDHLCRILPAVGEPLKVLKAVINGADLFDFDYPQVLTQMGYASTFQLWPPDWNVLPDESPSYLAKCDYNGNGRCTISVTKGLESLAAVPTNNTSTLKLRIRDPEFERDTGVLVNGCGCYTCRNHSKAYLNHLLNSHEMLGETLLHTHNVHYYHTFFAAIRQAIRKGRFQEYIEWFLDSNTQRQYWDSMDKM